MQQEETVTPGPETMVAITDPGEIDRADHGLLDRLVVRLANLCAWIFPILMLAICSQVVLRQLGHNQAWLDDFQWWLYGAAVLVMKFTCSSTVVPIMETGSSGGHRLCGDDQKPRARRYLL